MEHVNSSTHPTCPRCGYDLSGQYSAIEEDANAAATGIALVARCSECGLDFDWADIFNPYRVKVRGFIEHADRRLLAAAWRTWLLALRPSRFWRRVKIEFEPRPRRILLWPLLVPMLI